jgi:DNA-binding NarL/FixJ family response regulator
VVLLEVGIPGGLDAVVGNGHGARPTRILALGVPDEEDDVIACAEAGVAGYVMREDSLDALVVAIESVVRDEMLCSPRAAAALMRRVRVLSAERQEALGQKLTRRELEIVALIDEGLSNKAIAQRLCIELATVKNHVHNILEKLDVSRRAEAAARVRRQRGTGPGSPLLRS